MNISPALIWAMLGVALIIVELVSTTFVFIFLGIGAIITSVAAALGVENIYVQIIIFSFSSLLLTLVLRKMAKRLFAGHHDLLPDYIGQKVEVSKEMSAGKEGAVKYRGSLWIARAEGDQTIPVGAFVEVVGNDGIKLIVKTI